MGKCDPWPQLQLLLLPRCTDERSVQRRSHAGHCKVSSRRLHGDYEGSRSQRQHYDFQTAGLYLALTSPIQKTFSFKRGQMFEFASKAPIKHERTK